MAWSCSGPAGGFEGEHKGECKLVHNPTTGPFEVEYTCTLRVSAQGEVSLQAWYKQSESSEYSKDLQWECSAKGKAEGGEFFQAPTASCEAKGDSCVGTLQSGPFSVRKEGEDKLTVTAELESKKDLGACSALDAGATRLEWKGTLSRAAK